MAIRKCSCTHAFQDGRYGKGMRTHNPCKDGESLRCTVCGTERPASRRADALESKKNKK